MLIFDILMSSVTQGAIYVISALGIVLIYKTTRVMNFAHGFMAAMGGYLAYEVVTAHGYAFIVGVAVAVLAGALLGFLTDALIMGPLAARSHLELVIVTVGINYFLQAAVENIWGYDEHAIKRPFDDASVNLFGVDVFVYNIVLAVCGLAAVMLLTALLHFTSWGLKLRATFDDPVAARLTGVRVRRVRSIAWTLGGGLAGASGAFLAPVIYLSPERLPLILILSFCGAVIGGLTSLPGTIVGGVGAAFAFQAGSAYVSANYASVILYATIILVLWIRPHGIFGDSSEHDEAAVEGEREIGVAHWLAKRRAGTNRGGTSQAAIALRIAVHVAVGVVILFVLPALMGTDNITLGTFIVTFISVIGVSTGISYAGQISFGQIAFMMVGMFTATKIMGADPDKWWLGLLGGAAVSSVVAVLIGLPTVRLRGAYFAIVTLALALASTEIALNWVDFTGGYSGLPVFRPLDLTGSRWYYLIATIALACYYGLVVLRSSALGKRLVASRDDPEGAHAMGVSVFQWRLVTYVVTGTLGGIAGSVYALNVGYISATSLDFTYSMNLFIAAVLARSITGSLAGAALVTFVPIWLSGSQEVVLVTMGALLILAMFVLPKDLTHLDVVRLRGLLRSGGPDDPNRATPPVLEERKLSDVTQ